MKEPINWWSAPPWTVEETPSFLMVVAELGGLNAIVISANPISKRDRANAHLISAAPDLLMASKALLAWVEDCLPPAQREPVVMEDVRAAIAKAERTEKEA
jgi:hypothetical protein